MDSSGSLSEEDFSQKNIKRENIKQNMDDSELDGEDSYDDYNNNNNRLKQKQSTKLDTVVLPNKPQIRYYRACFRCHLIKTISQFESESCENCSEYLKEIKSKFHVNIKQLICKYEGMMAIMDPTNSWVSKKITKFLSGQKIVPGAYALRVQAEYQEIEDDFQSCAIEYVDNNKI